MTTLLSASISYFTRLIPVAFLPPILVLITGRFDSSYWPAVVLLVPVVLYAALPIFSHKVPVSFRAVIPGCLAAGTARGGFLLMTLR